MTEDDKALAEQLRSAAESMDGPLLPLSRMYMQLADRVEAYEVEIKQLAAQLKTVLDREAETHRRHDAKVEAQAAEIEQLREALERIASGRYSGVMLTSFPPKDAAVEAARAALGDME